MKLRDPQTGETFDVREKDILTGVQRAAVKKPRDSSSGWSEGQARICSDCGGHVTLKQAHETRATVTYDVQGTTTTNHMTFHLPRGACLS